MLEQMINKRIELKNRIKSIFLIALLTSGASFGQQTITGVVTSSKDGQPIPGVNVIVKGTATGVTTDFDGNYTVIASPEDVLVFSYIGLQTQEITVGGETIINTTLEEDLDSLDEVVVVGYGTQKKSDLTGAVADVEVDQLQSRAVTNISAGLSGLVSGVLVTQSSGGFAGSDTGTIRIRGIGTFNNSNPLVIVDGVQANINDIDPNDVESISVLKDAASAAIYGSRAANGVVLVTTKKGEPGKPVIEYNGYAGFQIVNRKLDYVNDSADWMEAANLLNGGEIFSQEEIQEWRDNPNDPLRYPNVNWYEEFVGRTAFLQNHSFSLSGGTDVTQYRFAINYLDQKGIRPGNDFDRYGFRLNVQSEPLKGLNVSSNLFFRWSDLSNGRAFNDGANVLGVGWAPLMPNIQSPDGRFGDAQSSAVGSVFNYNATLANSSITRREQRLLGDISVSYEILDGLKVTGKVALNFNNRLANNFTGTFDLWDFRRDIISRTINGVTNRRVSAREDQNYLLTSNFFLNYNKTFGKHDVEVFGGFETLQFRSDFISAGIDNLLSDQVAVINAGLLNPRVGGNLVEWALNSYFGRLSYNFDGKYLLQANFRADGSSRFAPDNRWGYFPAFSAGWVISKERFMEDMGGLNFLKLRASWGKLGNNGIGNYAYQDVYDIGQNYSFGGTVVAGAAQNRLVDPTIRWETTISSDIALEAILFNTLDLSFEYFHRETEDILTNLPIPRFLGDKSNPTVNLANMINQGFEVNLGYNGRIRDDFNYAISAHFTQVENEVTDYFADIKTGPIQIGLPFNSFWGYEAIGLFTSQEQLDAAPVHPGNTSLGDVEIKDQLTVDSDGDGLPDEGDGEINTQDQVFLGSDIPKFTYGGVINLNYRNVDFGFIFQGILNRDLMTWGESINPILLGDRGALHQRWLDEAWSESNPTGTLPRLNRDGFNNLNGSRGRGNANGYWVNDVSYFRVKNIQLGYSLPTNILDKLHLSRLRFYVSLDNPFLMTNEKWGVDPETGSGNRIPNVSSYIIGLNLRF